MLESEDDIYEAAKIEEAVVRFVEDSDKNSGNLNNDKQGKIKSINFKWNIKIS